MSIYRLNEFGATPNDISKASQNVTALQTALDNQGVIIADSGVWYLNDTIRLKSHTQFVGEGNTHFIWTHNGIGIDFYRHQDSGYKINTRLEKVRINGIILEGANDSYIDGNNCISIGINKDGQDSIEWGGLVIDDCIFYKWGDSAIKMTQAYSTDIKRNMFKSTYNGVEMDTVTGAIIERNVFMDVINDCITGVGDDHTAIKNNRTNNNIGNKYINLLNSTNPRITDNRWETTLSGDLTHAIWLDGVTGGYVRSANANVMLANACVLNEIDFRREYDGWAIATQGVYEDVSGGCGKNVINIKSKATRNDYDYGNNGVSDSTINIVNYA